jgi:hypothetical protein
MAHIEFGEGLQDGYVLSTDSILAGIQRYYDNNLEVNCTFHALYWREGWCIAIESNTVLLLTDDSRNVILIQFRSLLSRGIRRTYGGFESKYREY